MKQAKVPFVLEYNASKNLYIFHSTEEVILKFFFEQFIKKVVAKVIAVLHINSCSNVTNVSMQKSRHKVRSHLMTTLCFYHFSLVMCEL